MTDFRMPSLGADMERGTVVEWLVKPGDRVERGDVVILVETEKGIIEVEIWQDAAIESIVVPPGAEVGVGAVLATLTNGKAPSPVERKRISPRARAVAKELGVDATAVAAAGPVTEEAVRASAARDPATSMRRAIARAMARSKREIPHYYLGTTVDMTAALDFLHDRNADRPIDQRIIPAAMLIKATALAARRFPEMNGHLVDHDFQPSEAVNIGVAISRRDGGLVAPAIGGCDDLPLDELMKRLGDLVRRARSGHLRESEIAAPTITVTNLGDRGIEEGYGVIIPPQVALVCFGRIHEDAWAVDGAVTARPVVRATLSADHRVSDGHRGAQFLESIDHYLQQPEEL